MSSTDTTAIEERKSQYCRPDKIVSLYDIMSFVLWGVCIFSAVAFRRNAYPFVFCVIWFFRICFLINAVLYVLWFVKPGFPQHLKYSYQDAWDIICMSFINLGISAYVFSVLVSKKGPANCKTAIYAFISFAAAEILFDFIALFIDSK